LGAGSQPPTSRTGHFSHISIRPNTLRSTTRRRRQRKSFRCGIVSKYDFRSASYTSQSPAEDSSESLPVRRGPSGPDGNHTSSPRSPIRRSVPGSRGTPAELRGLSPSVCPAGRLRRLILECRLAAPATAGTSRLQISLDLIQNAFNPERIDVLDAHAVDAGRAMVCSHELSKHAPKCRGDRPGHKARRTGTRLLRPFPAQLPSQQGEFLRHSLFGT